MNASSYRVLNNSLSVLSMIDPSCASDPELYIQEKFIMIAVCGSIVASIGIVNNVVLVYLFLTRIHMRNTHLLYLGVLAMLDVLICGNYILLFVAEILYDYCDNYGLYILWHKYVRALFVTSRMTGTASTYLIIAASFERFMAVCNYSWTRRQCSQRDRFIVISGVLGFAVISRMSIFFELTVKENDNCTGTFHYVQLMLTPFAREHTYNTYYRLYFNNFLHILAPFVVLLCLNFLITIKMQQALRMRSVVLQVGYGLEKARDGRRSLKQATLSLIALVTSYLVCNILGFSLTIMEHISLDLLYAHMMFYTFASDSVNLLHVLNAMVRIFIYFLCNPQIRRGLHEIGEKCCLNPTVSPTDSSTRTYSIVSSEDVIHNNQVCPPLVSSSKIPCPLNQKQACRELKCAWKEHGTPEIAVHQSNWPAPKWSRNNRKQRYSMYREYQTCIHNKDRAFKVNATQAQNGNNNDEFVTKKLANENSHPTPEGDIFIYDKTFSSDDNLFSLCAKSTKV